MAIDITPTPTLKGDAAKNFMDSLSNSKPVDFSKQLAQAQLILDNAIID